MYLFKINKQNGSFVWKEKIFKSRENSIIGSGSIIIDIKSSIAYMHNGDSEIVSFDLKNKKLKWKKSFHLPFRSALTFSMIVFWLMILMEFCLI